MKKIIVLLVLLSAASFADDSLRIKNWKSRLNVVLDKINYDGVDRLAEFAQKYGHYNENISKHINHLIKENNETALLKFEEKADEFKSFVISRKSKAGEWKNARNYIKEKDCSKELDEFLKNICIYLKGK